MIARRHARTIRHAIADARARRWPAWMPVSRMMPVGPNVVDGNQLYRAAFNRTSKALPLPKAPTGPSGVSQPGRTFPAGLVTVSPPDSHAIHAVGASTTIVPKISELMAALAAPPRRSPQRIQQKRTKGWRKPEGAMSVVRGTDWGNPFKVGWQAYAVDAPPLSMGGGTVDVQHAVTITPALAVLLFETHLAQHFGAGIYDQIRRELRGKDLMCYCAPGAPCHADMLLRIANSDPISEANARQSEFYRRHPRPEPGRDEE